MLGEKGSKKGEGEVARSKGVPFTFFFFYFFLMFIHFFETKRDILQAGEWQREMETQSLKQAPGSELPAQSPTWGMNPQTMRS